jgi:hypothetical protein
MLIYMYFSYKLIAGRTSIGNYIKPLKCNSDFCYTVKGTIRTANNRSVNLFAPGCSGSIPGILRDFEAKTSDNSDIRNRDVLVSEGSSSLLR